MFGRRKNRDDANRPANQKHAATNSSVEGTSTDPNDTLLAETIARHFPNAQVRASTVDLGVGGVSIECRVADTDSLGAFQSAALYFRIRGGALGEEPIFASISGYETTVERAVVTGACNWACSFGPVLEAGLTGAPLADVQDVEAFETVLDGRRYRVLVGSIDRTMMFSDNVDGPARLRAARQRLGGQPMLTPTVLESGTLPALVAPGSSLLSVFFLEAPRGREVEVKVNGRDWAPSNEPFAGVPFEPDGAMCLLRELAMLVPLEPAPTLTRATLARTLTGLATREAVPQQATGWPGWRAHGGRLAPPLTAAELSDVETRDGSLPPDYREFLVTVAGSGAGPGYGLVQPVRHGDVVPLAHAGCGVTWVLRLDGEHYGQVWVDASGSDGRFARVAGSFREWYEAWLDAAVRDMGPWAQWDNMSCATPGVIVQTVESMTPTGQPVQWMSLADRVGPGAISLAGGGEYLPAGSALDPCHPCVAYVARFDLGPEVFGPGVLSRPGM